MHEELIKLEIYYLQNKDNLNELERRIIMNTIQLCNIKLENENE